MREFFHRMRLFEVQIIGFAAFLALTPVCFGAQQAGVKTTGLSANTGRQIFSSICASCHGLDGRGGERGPDIVARAEVARLSDEDLLKVLRNGIPEKGMPPFASFGSTKLSALLAYIRALQGKGDGAAVTGDAKQGKDLFFGKGGCSSCHMVNGSGGFMGPELSSYGRNHNAADIRTATVNPRGRAGERSGGAEVITKDGKSYSGLVRNEDNFSLQLQSVDGSFHFFSKSDVASINYRKEPLMPTDYGSKLSAAELDALAAYLLQVAHAGRKSSAN